MLYDKEFLLQLDQYQHKEIFARITSLTFDESPIEYIEGRITQGSINVDGSSAVRRSCSLTMVAQDFNYKDYYWGLNTKFKLEIGVKNYIDSSYPDIIWFNQGLYLITSFNTSRSTNNFTISLQGKDKMCLLNGDVGGSLESSVDFGTIGEEDKDGNWVIRKLPLQEIIKNAVHIYGKEPYHNIIINDLESYGLELLEYRYDTPMYLYREYNNPKYENVTLNGEKMCRPEGASKPIPLSSLNNDQLEMLVDSLTGSTDPSKIRFVEDNPDTDYAIAKISYGQTAGYRLTDLVFAGDLIANVGESVVSVLDKIKNMLTEFEYFYNLDGQFVFQKKRSFKESMLSFDSDKMQQTITQSLSAQTNYSYKFYGSSLITAFNNNPNLLNVKNDYSIWGERETVSGAKVPIHLRYAIDKKPIKYKNIRVFKSEVDKYNEKYNTKLKAQGDYYGEGEAESQFRYTYIAGNSYSIDSAKKEIYCDWREVIYQMAEDYYKYNFLDDFELRVAAANPDLYPTGRTGYEQYYIDLQGFWRQLYYPVESSELSEVLSKYKYYTEQIEDLNIELYGSSVAWSETPIGGVENDIKTLNALMPTEDSTPEQIEQLTAQAIQMINEFHAEEKYLFKDKHEDLITEPLLFLSLLQDHLFRRQSDLRTYEKEMEKVEKRKKELEDDIYVNYYMPKEGESTTEKSYWHKNVYESPDLLNFWFNFLDTEGELQQFSVRSIGSRPKPINDTNIKSIYFRETPSIFYGEPSGDVLIDTAGYRYIQANDIDLMFSCSARGKSAKEKLDELLYQHGYCIENATITTIPIYYLEPNSRIYLYDEETGLEGDYIVSKLTIPLAHNGTMSITATKAPEKIS